MDGMHVQFNVNFEGNNIVFSWYNANHYNDNRGILIFSSL
jgi:hypothetical protein